MNNPIKIASTDITQLLDIEIEKHDTELRGSSGKSKDFEDGFVAGLRHAKENLVAAAQLLSVQQAGKLSARGEQGSATRG